jgi:hypothetical protein
MEEPASLDGKLARAAEGVFATPFRGGPETALADALEEFGASHQIEAAEFCYVAVRRPTATRQEVTTGRTPEELLAKLRAERDGTA